MSLHASQPATLEYRHSAADRHRSPWAALARTVAIIGILAGLIFGGGNAMNYYQMRGATPLGGRITQMGIISLPRSGINAVAALILIVGGTLVCGRIRWGRGLMFVGAGWMVFSSIDHYIGLMELDFGPQSWSLQATIVTLSWVFYFVMTGIILTRPALFQRA